MHTGSPASFPSGWIPALRHPDIQEVMELVPSPEKLIGLEEYAELDAKLGIRSRDSVSPEAPPARLW